MQRERGSWGEEKRWSSSRLPGHLKRRQRKASLGRRKALIDEVGRSHRGDEGFVCIRLDILTFDPLVKILRPNIMIEMSFFSFIIKVLFFNHSCQLLI
jgi:hypothetical protein